MRVTQCLGIWLLLGCLAAPLAQAQISSGVPDNEVGVKVMEVKVEVDRCEDKFPAVRGVPPGGIKQWVRLAVAYNVEAGKQQRFKDLNGLFINELEFEWTVYFAAAEVNGKIDKAEGFRASKTYKEGPIKVDDKLKNTVVYLDPRMMDRYVKTVREANVYYTLRVKAGGKTIDQIWGQGNKWSRKDGSTPRSKNNDNLFTAEGLLEPKGALLTRDQTPWAWYGEDSYYEKLIVEPAK